MSTGTSYKSATMQVHAQALTDYIPLRRGVRQEDNISPRFFTAVLEHIMKTLECYGLGI